MPSAASLSLSLHRLAFLALGSVIACGPAPGPVSPSQVTSVLVSPPSLTLGVGSVTNLTVSVRGDAGVDQTVSWSSKNPDVATVSATGAVTGIAPGIATVIATSAFDKSKASASVVTVIPALPGAVATLTVLPGSASVSSGGTVQLTATARDASGNVLNGRAVTWQSSNPAIAPVSASGLVTGVSAAGQVTIGARCEGIDGISVITVTPIPVATVVVTPSAPSLVSGTTTQLTAMLKDANGNTLNGRIILWSTSNALVATVSGTGLVTGVSSGGPVTITATSETKSGTSSVTVTSVPVATIVLTPSNNAVNIGGTTQFTAVTKDAGGNVLAGRVVTWSSTNPGVASVSATGLVTGVTAGGPVTIAAASEGQNSTSQITVFGALPMVAVGAFHSCALTSDGTAYCWGANGSGELGDGTTAAQATPVKAGTGEVKFISIGVGTSHTCGLATTGDIFCWGDNSLGALGSPNSGGVTNQLTPALVAGGLSFTALAVGSNHSCAIATGGAAYCWGLNSSSQLGDGTVIARDVPTAVAGGKTFRSISAGDGHTCAVTLASAAYCWGNDTFGQIGDGSSGGPRSSPSAVAGGTAFTTITAGGFHTCGSQANGVTSCWGNNGFGQLGDGTTTNRAAPITVSGAHAFSQLGGGVSATCAWSSLEGAFCWGTNTSGQLGDGTTTQRTLPTAVIRGAIQLRSASNGGGLSCGVATTLAVYCWGNGSSTFVLMAFPP